MKGSAEVYTIDFELLGQFGATLVLCSEGRYVWMDLVDMESLQPG